MSLYDEMIEGAIDLHCHVDLEFSREQTKREPESSWIGKAEAMGIRGAVLKSHWWPTVHVVHNILSSTNTKLGLWSSATLNKAVGGPDPCIIEACAALGGKMIFLPTWSARNDIVRRGFSHRISSIYKTFSTMENPGIVFIDDGGKLIPSAYELIECCKSYELTMGTGHISWQESLAFVEAARDRGFSRVVINHPLSAFIEAPLDALKRAAQLGAFVEICWNHLAPGRMDSPELVAKVREIGVDQVVASTDYFRPYSPNPPELFRMFLGMLYEGGLKQEEIKRLACINPARALGLE